MKALKNAERPPQSPGSSNGTDWSLQPMESSNNAAGSGTPRTAQAAADLIRAREGSREGTRLAILLGVLVLVVAGMGAYFYVAVYMPWLLLPKPVASPSVATSAPPASAVSTPANPAVQAATILQRLPDSALPEVPQELKPVAPAPSKRNTFTADEIKPATRADTRRPVTVTTSARVAVPSAAPAASDGVLAAYELLQSGQYETARQAYEKLRLAQPGNSDVALGLAVIAQRQGRTEDAAQLYMRAIELDPRNSFAQAGLVGLIGKADPAAAEMKLKQLIRQQPAAYLHFALGNVYATQSRWNEAQVSFFEAQRLEPESADYAFNLAVSLEHIAQPKLAAEYYQRALRLAQGAAAVSFDPVQARSRLQQISRQ